MLNAEPTHTVTQWLAASGTLLIDEFAIKLGDQDVCLMTLPITMASITRNVGLLLSR